MINKKVMMGLITLLMFLMMAYSVLGATSSAWAELFDGWQGEYDTDESWDGDPISNGISWDGIVSNNTVRVVSDDTEMWAYINDPFEVLDAICFFFDDYDVAYSACIFHDETVQAHCEAWQNEITAVTNKSICDFDGVGTCLFNMQVTSALPSISDLWINSSFSSNAQGHNYEFDMYGFNDCDDSLGQRALENFYFKHPNSINELGWRDTEGVPFQEVIVAHSKESVCSPTKIGWATNALHGGSGSKRLFPHYDCDRVGNNCSEMYPTLNFTSESLTAYLSCEEIYKEENVGYCNASELETFTGSQLHYNFTSPCAINSTRMGELDEEEELQFSNFTGCEDFGDECFFRDSFTYGSNVLTWGWSGGSVFPSQNSEYSDPYGISCFGNMPNAIRLGDTGIWHSFKPFTNDYVSGVISFQLQDNYTEGVTPLGLFYLDVGSMDEGITAFSFSTYQGDIGVLPNDAILDAYDVNLLNNWSIVFYFSSLPYSYDIVLNGELIASGLEFKSYAEIITQIDYVYIRAHYNYPYRCNWRLFNISLFATTSPFTNGTFRDDRTYFLNWNATGGWQEQNCYTDELTVTCFIRTSFNSIFGWVKEVIIFGSLVIFVVFIICVIIYRMMKGKSKDEWGRPN